MGGFFRLFLNKIINLKITKNMRLFLSFFILAFAMLLNIQSISAQDRTILENQAFTVKGGANDTLAGSSTNTYSMYVKNWCEAFKVAIKQTNVSTVGTNSEGHYVVYSSLDNGDWTTVATLNLHASTLTSARYVTSATLSPKAPYIKIVATGGDSCVKQKFQYYIIVEKK